MFERRLKILLVLLLLIFSALVVRLAQIQILQTGQWTSEAARLARHYQYIQTTRGTIRDRRGRVLAEDQPCIEAAVDYRAIIDPPDPLWVTEQAEKRLEDQLEAATGSRRHPHDWPVRMAAEEPAVVSDLDKMWNDLAQVAGQTRDQIDDLRHAIVSRVEMRRRFLWWTTYQKAHGPQTTQPTTQSWYDRWLSSEPSGGKSGVDAFGFDLAEQTQAHTLIATLDADQQARLARHLEHYPGLVLRPGQHRVYPLGRAACHIVGNLGTFGPEDFDPYPAGDLRHYRPNDLIGKAGVEALCEGVLRGARGQVENISGQTEPATSIDPIPGRDVRLSIDIELQAELEQALAERREFTLSDGSTEVRENQHGAAVVIDVASGEVLALASNPGFDPNTLDTQYAALARDEINQPLLNRATQMALEPGSSVKPIVGCGAITDGFMTPTSTVECTGYLILDGHTYSVGRCWIASEYESKLGKNGVAHHPEPWDDPHPTGFLTITDGLERSCNVVFETIADKMGMHELAFWFDRFGLGRPTGIGLAETGGLIPPIADAPKNSPARLWTCFAAAGRGWVRATPMQMANAAATLAREGIWLRPQLVAAADVSPASTRPVDLGPDRADLQISPAALAAVREGMLRVTSTRAGTGTAIHGPDYPRHPDPGDPLIDIPICGKTGTAQAALLTIPLRDDAGELQRDAQGRIRHETIPLGDPRTAGWYLGAGDNRPTHAWYIGFAPADHPQVAFAVMVEYGGAGGRVAGAIAHDALAACLRYGYLAHVKSTEASHD